MRDAGDGRTSIHRDTALQAAEVVREHLGGTCERYDVAGSLRRGAPTVKDIDIVVQPQADHDLFGGEAQWTTAFVDTVSCCERWTVESQLTPRSRQVTLASRKRPDVKVELWLAPEERYGFTLLLRTGPAEFTRRLAQVMPRYGLRMIDGQVWTRRSDARGDDPLDPRLRGHATDAASLATDLAAWRHAIRQRYRPVQTPQERDVLGLMGWETPPPGTRTAMWVDAMLATRPVRELRYAAFGASA